MKRMVAVIAVGLLAAAAVVVYILGRPNYYNVPTPVAERFAQHGWAVAGEATEGGDALPEDFLLRSGRFPWRVYLDLSAASGLDFSHLTGHEVKTLRFPVNEASGGDRLKEIREEYLLLGMAMLDQDGQLVGAWLTYVDRSGEVLMGMAGYSLDGQELGEVTGLGWSAYAEKYNPENQVPDGFHPFGTHIGRPVVDRVIDALVRGNGPAMEGMIKLDTLPCAEPYVDDIGTVPCPEGTPNGTNLEVLHFGSCHPNRLVGADLAAAVVRNRFSERHYLYAVYQVAEGYRVIVGSGDGDRGSRLYLDSLGFITDVVNCGPPGPDSQATALLPPIR